MAASRAQVDPSWWSRPELREALGRRDIRTLYRFLQSRGFSQTRIASLTGQSQTEVWAIVSQGREVIAYEVFVRIADGLGIPRGLMGLAYTLDVAVERDDDSGTESGHVKRRDFLGVAAKITVGAGLTSADLAILAAPAGASPIPEHIGIGDVQRLHDMTTVLDAQDRAFGGGACRDAIVGYLNWATKLRNATMTDDVRLGLNTALAELECLASWVSYDMRLHDSAEHYSLRAVYSARLADEPLLVANALNCLGYAYSKDGHYGDAMRAYQLAGMAAAEVGSPGAVAKLALSEAQVHARRGNAKATLDAVHKGEDEFARVDEPGDAGHTLFFTEQVQLHMFALDVYSDLAEHDEIFAPRAIEEALRAIPQIQATGRARTLLGTRAVLALNHYRCGDTTAANEQTAQVLAALPQVSSRRVLTSLRPLAIAAAAHRTDSTATDLAHRIHTHASR